MNATMSSRNDGSSSFNHWSPKNGSSHHHRPVVMADVDFPNDIKLDHRFSEHSDRMSFAMQTLEKEINVLEKQMVVAGQKGDFRTARSKENRRNSLMQHRNSLTDLNSCLSSSSSHRGMDDSKSTVSRESILQAVEDELGITPPPQQQQQQQQQGASSSRHNRTRLNLEDLPGQAKQKQALDAVSMSSRVSQPSHPRRKTKKKKRHQAVPVDNNNIVSLVNNVLVTAPDTVKEDFANGVVYKRTNDDRLNTIYEMERNNSMQQQQQLEQKPSHEQEEEACVKVSNVQLVDPYGDSGRYSGMAVRRTGVPHGLGRFWYRNDDRTYEGEWRYGQWHGFGRSTCANGDVYEGEYRQDQRHGVGTYEWKNDGRQYKGDFYQDRRHGRGIMTWPNGTTYQGGFVMGHLEGQGKMIYPDGRVEVGEWVRDKLKRAAAEAPQPQEDVFHDAAASPSDSLSSFEDASPPRHARMPSSFSELSENSEKEWTCGMCTYVNSDPLHLSCAVCGHARTAKRPLTLDDEP